MNKKTSGNENQILIYKTETGQYAVEVLMDGNTVWLTQQQMAELFETTKQNVGLHIRNIFAEGELKENSVVKDFFTTASDGKSYRIKHYNLDVIISVGYRVKSLNGIQFRIWATNTLREHLLKGYTINQKRLAETGVKKLENALQFITRGIGITNCRKRTKKQRVDDYINQEFII
jgi:hypothetical protein